MFKVSYEGEEFTCSAQEFDTMLTRFVIGSPKGTEGIADNVVEWLTRNTVVPRFTNLLSELLVIAAHVSRPIGE